MTRYVVASYTRNAGKTSIIVGLGASMEGRFSYLKPLGDRLLYKKKNVWDHDAALVKRAFDKSFVGVDVTLGFEQAKLRYAHTRNGLHDRLRDMADTHDTGDGPMFIEGGGHLTTGMSVGLDPMSIVDVVGGELIVVLAGNEETVMDGYALVASMKEGGIPVAGVIINKATEPDMLRDELEALEVTDGPEILGIIPHRPEFDHPVVREVSDHLFARIIAGERGLENRVMTTFVAAMSAAQAVRHPLFSRKGKLMLTSGDRSDLILAALETDTAGIVLSNSIMPPSSVIAAADTAGIPLLMVPYDTFEVARRLESYEPPAVTELDARFPLLEETIASSVILPSQQR